MRIETRTVRIGERVGDIDWSYNFRSHFDCYACRDDVKDVICQRHVDRLKLLEDAFKAGKECKAEDYCVMKKVLDIGMYDGWPWWKPVPHVLLMGTLGPEWISFCTIKDVEI